MDRTINDIEAKYRGRISIGYSTCGCAKQLRNHLDTGVSVLAKRGDALGELSSGTSTNSPRGKLATTAHTGHLPLGAWRQGAVAFLQYVAPIERRYCTST